MVGWKSLNIAAGTGWKSIGVAAGTGWKELTFESAVDIGAACIDRAESASSGFTVLNKENPANANGTLTSLCLWVEASITGLKIGTFELIDLTTYKCRDAETIGALSQGKNDNIVISLTVVTGDLIGYYFTTGGLEYASSGGLGFVYKSGDHININSEESYTNSPEGTISCYAEG